jgi:hypothetical protein
MPQQQQLRIRQAYRTWSTKHQHHREPTTKGQSRQLSNRVTKTHAPWKNPRYLGRPRLIIFPRVAALLLMSCILNGHL